LKFELDGEGAVQGLAFLLQTFAALSPLHASLITLVVLAIIMLVAKLATAKKEK
jgi:hypothetical protein